MIDHGLVTAVRQNLLSVPSLADFRIFTVLPPQRSYPFILIDLKQIWSAFAGHSDLERKRAVFSIKLYTQGAILTQPHRVMGAILKAGDGVKLDLEAGHKAILRFLRSEGVEPDRLGVRVYLQQFEALIV